MIQTVLDFEMEKHAKFKETFKVSKLKVKEWEKSFVEENGRKPSKDEMKNAPPQIQICYKNCWKIKAYFEAEAKSNTETSLLLDEDSQSQIETSKTLKSDEEKKSETPCSDITNTRSGLSKGVWGEHLNKKEPVKSVPTSFNFSGLSTKLDLSLSQGSTTKTRTSLKKRNRTIQSFQSFTDTLGTLDDNATVNSDPKPIPMASSQPAMFLSEDLFRTEDSQEATLKSPTSKEDIRPIADTNSKEAVKDDSDGEDITLFPNLNLKHEPKEKAPKTSSFKPLQSGMRRKVDSDWLSRCTGIATEPLPGHEKEELPKTDREETRVNFETNKISGEVESKEIVDTTSSSGHPKDFPEIHEKSTPKTLTHLSEARQPIVQKTEEEVVSEPDKKVQKSTVIQKSKAVKRRNRQSSDEEADAYTFQEEEASDEKPKKSMAVKRRKRGSSDQEESQEDNNDEGRPGLITTHIDQRCYITALKSLTDLFFG